MSRLSGLVVLDYGMPRTRAKTSGALARFSLTRVLTSKALLTSRFPANASRSFCISGEGENSLVTNFGLVASARCERLDHTPNKATGAAVAAILFSEAVPPSLLE